MIRLATTKIFNHYGLKIILRKIKEVVIAHEYNEAARVQKNQEFGAVWEEKLTNAQGTLQVPKYAPIRVRAAGATTVTIGGVLSATMSTGEVIIFNSGIGEISDTKRTVTVVIAGANAFVQVGRTVEKKREDAL